MRRLILILGLVLLDALVLPLEAQNSRGDWLQRFTEAVNESNIELRPPFLEVLQATDQALEQSATANLSQTQLYIEFGFNFKGEMPGSKLPVQEFKRLRELFRDHGFKLTNLIDGMGSYLSAHAVVSFRDLVSFIELSRTESFSVNAVTGIQELAFPLLPLAEVKDSNGRPALDVLTQEQLSSLFISQMNFQANLEGIDEQGDFNGNLVNSILRGGLSASRVNNLVLGTGGKVELSSSLLQTLSGLSELEHYPLRLKIQMKANRSESPRFVVEQVLTELGLSERLLTSSSSASNFEVIILARPTDLPLVLERLSERDEIHQIRPIEFIFPPADTGSQFAGNGFKAAIEEFLGGKIPYEIPAKSNKNKEAKLIFPRSTDDTSLRLQYYETNPTGGVMLADIPLIAPGASTSVTTIERDPETGEILKLGLLVIDQTSRKGSDRYNLLHIVDLSRKTKNGELNVDIKMHTGSPRWRSLFWFGWPFAVHRSCSFMVANLAPKEI